MNSGSSGFGEIQGFTRVQRNILAFWAHFCPLLENSKSGQKPGFSGLRYRSGHAASRRVCSPLRGGTPTIPLRESSRFSGLIFLSLRGAQTQVV
jgi:hypothetical protein